MKHYKLVNLLLFCILFFFCHVISKRCSTCRCYSTYNNISWSFLIRLWALLCSREGKRAICLGPPFSAYPEVFYAKNFLIFLWKTYYPPIRVSTLLSQGPPPATTVQCVGFLFSVGPQQQLQCVKYSTLKGPPTATVMCKYSTFERAPNTKWNALSTSLLKASP